MDLESTEPQKESEKKEPEIVFENAGDEVTNLQIPEIIWQRALANIENFKVDQEQVISEADLSLKFLATLMKNSKHLSYKRLKDVIINHIVKISDSLDTKIKIIFSKLEKYNEKDIFKKAISKFIKFVENNNDNKNYIISKLIENLKLKVNEFSFDSDKKEQINEYILKNLSKLMDQQELIDGYISAHNYSLTQFIYDESTYSNNKYNNLFDLKNIITKIILKNFENGTTALLNEYLNIYWKFAIYNLSQDAETTIDNLLTLYSQNKKKINQNFNKIFFTNLIKIIKEDVKLFPDRSLALTNKIIELIRKTNITDLQVLKENFKNLIEMIFVNNIFILECNYESSTSE